MGGQNRFRVELEAAYAAAIVAYRHHHLAEPGVDGQIGRDVTADQRVVTRHRQRVGHAGEHAFTVVNDRRGFAVQDFPRLADLAAIGFDDRLVAEADADDRQPASRRRCSSSGMQPASEGAPGPGDSISTGCSICARRSMITSAAIWLR